jgi:hypothetical protein
LGVIVSDTVEPDTVPVSVPLALVVPYVPVNDEPICAMVKLMTHEVIKLVPHLVPPQIPATFAVDGAVGVESQLVAKDTVRATAIMTIIRRSRLWAFMTSI